MHPNWRRSWKLSLPKCKTLIPPRSLRQTAMNYAYIWCVVLISPTSLHFSHNIQQPASRIRCHIGFAELAMSLPDSHVASTIPVLVDILRDVPLIDFDESLSWEGVSHSPINQGLSKRDSEWALPDQLVSTTVSALLRLSTFHAEYRATSMEAILLFASRIVSQLQTGTCKTFPSIISGNVPDDSQRWPCSPNLHPPFTDCIVL
jgi:hypothetical protein